jgi:O-antigen/teichoic acid export membrane protein
VTVGLLVRMLLEVIFGLRGFLVVPLIARRLGPADYGAYSQIWATVSLVVPLISLSLDNGIIRNTTRRIQETGRASGVVWSALIAGAATSVSCALLLPWTMQEFVSRFIFGNSGFGIESLLAGVLVVPATVMTIGQGYFQARGEYVKVSMLQGTRAIASVAAMAVVAFQGGGVREIIAAAALVEFLALATMILMVYKRAGGVTWNWPETKSMIVFSWPLAVSNVLYLLLNYIPRYSLVHRIGLESVGIYSVSYAVTSLLGQVASPIHYVVYPECLRLVGAGDVASSNRLLDVSIKVYAALCGITVAVMTVWGAGVVRLLANDKFQTDSMLFLALGIGTSCWGVFRLLSIQPLAYDRPRGILWALAGGCLVCQLASGWFVSQLKATGAGFTFLIANISLLICLLPYLRTRDRAGILKNSGGWILKVGAASVVSSWIAGQWSARGWTGAAAGIAAAIAAYALVLGVSGYSQVRAMIQTVRNLGHTPSGAHSEV